MLVVQGDTDQVLPLDKTGKRLLGPVNDIPDNHRRSS